MKDSSSYPAAPIVNYRLRSWVESIMVISGSPTRPNTIKVPVGLLDGSKRFLEIDIISKRKHSLSLRELVSLIRLLKKYPSTVESHLLRRAIAIIYLLETRRFKRYSMLVIAVVLYHKWRLRGNTLSPYTSQPVTTKYGIDYQEPD